MCFVATCTALAISWVLGWAVDGFPPLRTTNNYASGFSRAVSMISFLLLMVGFVWWRVTRTLDTDDGDA